VVTWDNKLHALKELYQFRWVLLPELLGSGVCGPSY